MICLERRHSNVWKFDLMGFENAEQHYCHRLHISAETLTGTTLGDYGVVNLLEKNLDLLQIQGFAPLGFSRQYESQHDLGVKVFYLSLIHI